MKYLNKEEVISHLNNKNYDTVITNYLPMVGHISRNFRIKNYDYEDLFSIGTIGLIEGVKRIVPHKDKHPSSYLYRSIKNEIIEVLNKEQKDVSIVSVNENIFKYNNGKCSFEDLLEEHIDFNAGIRANECKDVITDALNILTDVKRIIIECRYGINGKAPCTQKALADSLGISRSAVAMAERRALRELKEYITATYNSEELW